jgi:hypothetical protein
MFTSADDSAVMVCGVGSPVSDGVVRWAERVPVLVARLP